MAKKRVGDNRDTDIDILREVHCQCIRLVRRAGYFVSDRHDSIFGDAAMHEDAPIQHVAGRPILPELRFN